MSFRTFLRLFFLLLFSAFALTCFSTDSNAVVEHAERSAPTDADIFRSEAFEEPLVPIGGKTNPAENAALSKAIFSYARRAEKDDVSEITSFLDAFPKSAWRPALLLNIGLEYRRTGWFLKALAAWEAAWKLGKDDRSQLGKPLVDRAIGELAELNARLGRREKVEAILKEIAKRPITGPATEKITMAREGTWMMRNEPGKAFKCGPFALAMIRGSQDPKSVPDQRITDADSTDHGMSLDRVWELSSKLGMGYEMAKRVPGAPIIVPSVVNWKVNHYAALIREQNGRYLIKDPTFGPDMSVSKAALDSEGSGYFLVPRQELPNGWKTVSVEEAKNVWGMGNTGDHDTTGTKPFDDKVCNSKPPPPGMAVYNFHTQLVSLNITDIPVGYTPPVGPDMHFRLTYNQREASRTGGMAYPNFGPKWICDWITYLSDPGDLGAGITSCVPGGGSEFFYRLSYAGPFSPALQSRAVLSQAGYNPNTYVRTLPDGTKQIFDQGTARVFMSQIIDPAGKVTQLSYDANTRLTSVTDALGRTTQIAYVSDDPSQQINFYLISRITDPFGRYASFEYQNGHLWKIHDTIGIISEFAYNDPNDADFVTSMTTPYGTTTFSHPASSLDTDPNHPGNARVIQAVDPTGAIERLEYGHNAPGIPATDPNLPNIPGRSIINGLYNYRNSFYWDKQATALYPADANGYYDFTKAKLTEFLHVNDGVGNTVSNIKEREKQPLENPVYYFYDGQTADTQSTVNTGTKSTPNKIARVLDDGTTQLWQFESNDLEKVTKATDPTGRVTSYVYDANNIDLVAVYQRNPNGASTDPYDSSMKADLIASYTYDPSDPPHRPHTYTDAAGQMTTYTYNSNGQLLTAQNARSETTTWTYGPDTGVPTGYLKSITSPDFNGSSAITSFTYDSANRVHTVATSPDNYTVSTDYDALDRPTLVTFGDDPQTTQQFKYTEYTEAGVDTGKMLLDLTQSKDRRGHWTYRHYDANRHMDWVLDPLGRRTRYDYCACGALTTITDPKLHVTTFNRDVQSRVTSKVFDDTTSINYAYENTTSRLKNVTDAKQQVTNYIYNPDNTIQQIGYTDTSGQPLSPPTPTVNFGYDPSYNRVMTMTDGTGTTNYTYVPVTSTPTLGATQLQSVDGPPHSNSTITYGYDELGRRVSRTINGATSAIAYDSLGRLGTSDNPLGHFSRTYDGTGHVTPRLKTLSFPNGQTSNFSYFDNSNDRRLQTLQDLTSGAGIISKFDYTYDPEGQIYPTWTKQLSTSPAVTSNLTYDMADQLTAVQNTTPNNPPTNFSYGYDLAGNRISDSTASYSINDVNEITNTGYTYDLDGNLTGDGVNTYEWDAANRLTAIVYPGTDGRTEFIYDGLGRRFQLTEKQGADGGVYLQRKYLWDGMELAEERDATGATVRKRFLPEGVQITANPSPNSKLFYSRDHLGSIRGLTNETGAILATLDYDAYGSISRAPVPANDTSGAGPTLVSAVSQLVHGSAGTFNVNLPLSGAPGIEMRSGGSYTLVLTFDRPVLAATSATLASGVGSVTGAPIFVGNTATVQLSGVVDRQTITLELDNVVGATGTTANVFVAMSVLIGDVNQSGSVNYTDVALVKAHSSEVADSTTFIYDTNHDGVVNSADIGQTKATAITGDSLFPDFAFTGHYYHARSGLYLTMYRAYNPTLGRWITRDPIGEAGGLNLYNYVLDDPVNAFDPDGRDIYYANHEVAGGYFHSKLVIIPDNQAKYKDDPRFRLTGPDGKHYATIGAGPDDFGYPFLQPSYLQAGIDRREDVSKPRCNQQKLEVPTKYSNEDAAIDALFGLVNNYQTGSSKPVYTLLPNSVLEWNSNSFIRGLLNAAGFTAPANSGAKTPGYNNPVPRFYFQRN